MKDETVYETHELEHKGRLLIVKYHFDNDHDAPWDDHDEGRGVVTNKPSTGDVYMSDDHYFDWDATMRKATKDGWGVGINGFMMLTALHRVVPSKRMCIEHAVRKEFNFLDGWVSEDWHYMGVEVEDVETGVSESLWGIESCSVDYIQEVILELAEQVYVPSVEALLLGQVA